MCGGNSPPAAVRWPTIGTGWLGGDGVALHMPITTPEQLRDHLELAVAIELSTVPTYLYAMYSIEDQSSDAALLIRSVVAEEMLHSVLATNLLLAIGGEPDFLGTGAMPTYPSEVPHHQPPLTLNLKPCSQQQVEELFLVIEQPETHSQPAEDDEYESLGQFYHAIERAIASISQTHALFDNPQLDRQMAQAGYYRPVEYDAEDSGGLAPIDNIEAANEVIHIIVHQGEGVSDEKWADPMHQELTHYHKFLQIAEGKAPLGEVRAAPTNPRSSTYPTPIREVSDLFNAAYRYLYLTMHEIYQSGGDRDAMVGRLYRLMSDILSPLAHHLMAQPLGDGVAAPTFEVYEFGGGDPRSHLIELANHVAAMSPQLSGVAAAIAAL